VKSNKKGFYKYIKDKRKSRENLGPVLSAAAGLVTYDTGKAEVLNAFFPSTANISLQESQAHETRGSWPVSL